MKEEELEKKDTIVSKKRKIIGIRTHNIPSKLGNTYYKLKQEEIKFSNLANRLGLNYVTMRSEDANDIYSSIAQIKINMQNISEKVQNTYDVAKLDEIGKLLQELEKMTDDAEIKDEHIAEMKEKFEVSFDKKVKELIRDSRISKLEEERVILTREKISLLGKLLGKERLKQEKINNLNLKMQLLRTETEEYTEKYSLEESISDLYTYFKCELGKTPSEEIQKFLNTVKKEEQLNDMVDKKVLKEKLEEKVKNSKFDKQLAMMEDNSKAGNRRKVDMLQLQNNDINRQIQNNRAKTVTRQNNASYVKMKSNKALSKFKKIVNKINTSTQDNI